MKPSRGLLCWLLLPWALHAATPLENARRAQALLGPETWSRVVCVENAAPHRPYPARVYALVFEEAGILWFYTDADGTQSLSLHPDRLAEEKADLLPLLADLDPGFVHAWILPETDGETVDAAGGGLPNGCFVESLAALRERIQRGERVRRARLLSCYFDTPSGQRGHTVLTYETPHGVFLLDPERAAEPQRVPRAWADDARALAGAALPGLRIARVRWVPIALPASAPRLLASADSISEPVPDVTLRGPASRPSLGPSAHQKIM